MSANSEKQLKQQIAVLEGDKEELGQEIHELKSHLAAAEEQKEQQRRELGDAHRIIKEGQLLFTYWQSFFPSSGRKTNVHK